MRAALALPIQPFDLGIIIIGAPAGTTISIGAFAGVAAIAAIQFAQPFIALAHVAPALFVSFGLAGRGQVDCARRDAHRRGNNIGDRADTSACQRQQPKRKAGNQG